MKLCLLSGELFQKRFRRNIFKPPTTGFCSVSLSSAGPTPARPLVGSRRISHGQLGHRRTINSFSCFNLHCPYCEVASAVAACFSLGYLEQSRKSSNRQCEISVITDAARNLGNKQRRMVEGRKSRAGRGQ
ncbi:hypothetical protein RRG08_067196 [Elysia crispata]|uniref:Uncharacterized protein n=1 Tax=Elysia crispata TaxID=231223 RepID=A0AAE0Y9M9_9GAST|nr:hypothetical protein RRG08_067196 [Elysia crispata]